jgi:hypothetical protein
MCLALIDADIILYKAASAAQHKYYNVYAKSAPQEEEFRLLRAASAKAYKDWLKEHGKDAEDFQIVPEIEVQEPFQATLITDMIIRNILLGIQATSSLFFLSDDKNFRHALATTKPYKDRSDVEKPVHYSVVKDHLKTKYSAITLPNLEADDCIAMAAEESALEGDACVIVSIDKDFKQIPGLHYHMDKGEFFAVTVEESLRHFFTQVLMGDSTDDIPGLPKIGIKTAEKILSGCDTLDDMITAVIRAYQDKSPVSDYTKYLNEQANLVYLRRHPEIGVEL